MRANSRRNYERVHIYGDAPITANTWTHLERDPSLSPRRTRLVYYRIGMICTLIAFTFLSSYIPFSNFVIASAFIACTFILCVGAMVVVVRDMQREDAETEQMYSISAPGETEMNELMTSAEMVAQARNIAAQRMVDRDHDFVSKHLA
jgi:hypothetical protein